MHVVSLVSLGTDYRMIQLEEGQEAVVGRASDLAASNRFESGKISGRHCRFFVKDGKVSVEDLSKNGTFIDNANVSETHAGTRTRELAEGMNVVLTNPKKVTEKSLIVGFLVKYNQDYIDMKAKEAEAASQPADTLAPCAPPAPPAGASAPAKKKFEELDADKDEDDADDADEESDSEQSDYSASNASEAASPPAAMTGAPVPAAAHNHAFSGSLDGLKACGLIPGTTNMNSFCGRGNTLLYSASRWGHLDMVKYIVETLQASVGQPNKSNKSTPLHGAAYGGHAAIVEYLMQAGASVKPMNKFGENPLSNAASPADGVPSANKDACVRLIESASAVEPGAKKAKK
eukprot:TRINITY_DN6958_c0_g3_i2.p1 TRINITY_DN6958_c0_g3~~TRINITY_DN6958_c0_g3_i2.p1  ORF type:complete len:346 (+),score=119.49 TRINITY_DN6958_c0_g3_i2:1276-2313(+)